MITGRTYMAEVKINELELGEIQVTVGLDRTMTLVFPRGEMSIGALDEMFNSEPDVTIDGEVLEARKLQAYRVDASGTVEVSFLSDIEPEPSEEPFMNEPIEESEENADED